MANELLPSVPLFIISNRNIAPIPGSNECLYIEASKLHLFSTVSDETATGEPVTEWVIIGISSGDEDPYDIMQNPTEGVDDEPTVYSVGILCKILDREQVDDIATIEIQAVSRTYLRTLKRGQDPADPFTIWADLEPISEGITSEEDKKIRDQIMDVSSEVVEHPEFWVYGDPAYAIGKLRQSETAVDRMDILADYLLVDSDRLNYLQHTNLLDRWRIVLANIRRVVGDSEKNKEKKRRAISPPPVPAKPSKPKARSKKTETWKERVQAAPIPEEQKESILREVDKLNRTPKSSNEYSQTVDYLTWVLSLPWGKTSYEPINLKGLNTKLSETHYGLDDVKEHMLEVLCAQQLRGESSGQVLCFTGPPGVGKTTIAKAIAEASNRPLIQIALGGLQDVAELRGHRRTYVASRPGRIIAELKSKGTQDPLILLDEIDKLGHYRGDPSSALLEILDPEQNDKFVDHYLEIPFDLSKAMFICTANYENLIPAPLKDRMEFIRFRKYTLEERKEITSKFLLPKIMSKFDIEHMRIEFTPEALDTAAAIPQVRVIEKVLAKCLRTAMTQIHVYDKEEWQVLPEQVKSVKKNYASETKPQVGFSKR